MKNITKIMIAVSFMTTLCACAENKNDAEANDLLCDKEYIYEYYQSSGDLTINAKSTIVFHTDGSGEYIHHYEYTHTPASYFDAYRHYIINFKYVFVDNDKSTVACFYNGIERLEGDDWSMVNTDWSLLLNVSKNVVISISTSGYALFVNEDYFKTLDFYRK